MTTHTKKKIWQNPIKLILMARVRSHQIIVSSNILFYTDTYECQYKMSLKGDNSLITAHSGNIVQDKRLLEKGRCARQKWHNTG